MKRLALLVAVVGLVGGALATANAATTRTVCHRTSSAKKPYVKLRVSARQLGAHLKHAADIVPAPGGGCPRTLLSAAAGGRAFPIALTGEAESPAGDPVATATATVRLRAGQGQLCYQVATKDLPAAAAMHIHKGGPGQRDPWSCRSGHRTRPARRAGVHRPRGRSSRRSSPIPVRTTSTSTRPSSQLVPFVDS